MRTRHAIALVLTLAVSAAAIVSAASSAPAGGADWSGWRGPNRDGKSTDTGLLQQWPANGPPLRWQAGGIGEGYSSVAVADGAVYITGSQNNQCVISCFNAAGERQWEKEHGPAWTGGPGGVRGTPVIDEGRLYLISGHGKIACYQAADGAEIWTAEMSQFGGKPGHWGFTESPLILGDKVIIGPGGKQCLIALDKRTGEKIWTSPGNGGSAHYTSAIHIVHAGIPMIIHGNSAGIFAVDPDDGRVLWQNDFSAGNTANCPTPGYSNGYVFWANGYGKGGICLKLERAGRSVSAVEVYKTEEMDCHHGGFVLHEGYVYGNHGGGWNCLELATGKRMWRSRGPGKGSLCFADGMLYLFGEKNGQAELVAARPDSFDSSGSFKVAGEGPSWSHPVVTGGLLYLRYADNLYCFDVTAR